MIVPEYRKSPEVMEHAATRIGCELYVPHIGRGWQWEVNPSVILVTNNSTDAKWWQQLGESATALCWIKGRLAWKSTLQGQTAFYFGADTDAFRRGFGQFGFCGVTR